MNAVLDCIVLQLYVKGEFVGGADILEEMHNKGELKELLQSWSMQELWFPDNASAYLYYYIHFIL